MLWLHSITGRLRSIARSTLEYASSYASTASSYSLRGTDRGLQFLLPESTSKTQTANFLPTLTQLTCSTNRKVTSFHGTSAKMSNEPFLAGELSKCDYSPVDDANSSSNLGGRRGHRLRQLWSIIDNILRLLAFVMLIAILIITILIRNQPERSAPQAIAPKTQDDSWGVLKSYGDNRDYMSLDHKFDHLWDWDLKGNNALIKLDWNEEWNVYELGGIGMFHSLHCLAGIRKALQRSREGEDVGLDFHDDPHWPHCLYYLRQGILCSADNTIELPTKVNGSHRSSGIDGVADVRKCRDSSALYELRTQKGFNVA